MFLRNVFALFCVSILCWSSPINFGSQNSISDSVDSENRGVYVHDKQHDTDYYDSISNSTTVNETNEDSDFGSNEDEDDDDNEQDSEEKNKDILSGLKHRKIFVDEKLDTLLNPNKSPSDISDTSANHKSFKCTTIKSDLITGTSVGDLSPEDIGIIASMGDALSTGIGLWPRTHVEFRGASFTSGGDATIDGLITIPNILREFNEHLIGVSHGMGSRDQLPEHQLNVAQSGATSRDLPAQANELVRRLNILGEVDYKTQWVLILVTIGTEEVCTHCRGADYVAITETIDILQKHVPKALIVLLGPLHVSYSSNQTNNWLRKRCRCVNDSSMDSISGNWSSVFKQVEEHVAGLDKGPTFEVVTLPSLTITSRLPNGLFLPNTPLLNRRGHMYATKWLWNRLIFGERYNLSAAILSSDSFICPPTGCPYFRTPANYKTCQLLSHSEAKDRQIVIGRGGKTIKIMRRTPQRLYTIAIVIVCVAFFVVCSMGTLFYQRSKQGTHRRFEVVEDAQLKFEDAKKEEERQLLSRQNTRVLSTDQLARSISMSARRLNSECE